jgi:hypothetical protein
MAKPTKKGAAKGKAKGKPGKKAPAKRGELRDDEVERAAGGGGADFFLKLEGIDGESTSSSPNVLSTYSVLSPPKLP